MIRATVEFPVKSRADAVDLTDDGWRHRVAAAPALERLLDRFADPAAYRRAAFDPVAFAAAVAAELLDGVVAFVREPEPDATVS
jgi:hypothetical protein